MMEPVRSYETSATLATSALVFSVKSASYGPLKQAEQVSKAWLSEQ
jgi:hypothetical protein